MSPKINVISLRSQTCSSEQGLVCTVVLVLYGTAAWALWSTPARVHPDIALGEQSIPVLGWWCRLAFGWVSILERGSLYRTDEGWIHILSPEL